MRVYVELPRQWAPGQLIITAWTRAGYLVDEVRHPATGQRRMLVHGGAVAPEPTSADGTDRP
jgi:hypothetical protein